MAMWERTRLTLGLALLLGLLNVGSAAAQPSTPGIVGTVQSVEDGVVTLTDGSTFGVTGETRITIVRPATATDLSSGQYVAITAQRGVGGLLLASVISTFPEGSRGVGEGQFPLDSENLMTNATIDDAVLDEIEGVELTVTYLGETSRVLITPDTRVQLRLQGTLEDVVRGATVSARVVDGFATNVTIAE